MIEEINQSVGGRPPHEHEEEEEDAYNSFPKLKAHIRGANGAAEEDDENGQGANLVL